MSMRVRPHVARVLARTHTVLIPLDGTLCDFFRGVDTAAIANGIYEMLFSAGHRMSVLTAIEPDPLAKMGYAYSVGPNYGAQAEEMVREAELAAATTAVPASGAQEVLQACRASGRRVVVVGDTCSAAIEAYLDLHGLRHLAEAVVGREQRPALSEWPGVDLVRQAVKALGAEPSGCTLVSMSVLGMWVAAEVGIRAIGVVSRNGSRKHLAGIGGSVVVSTLPELAGALTTVPVMGSHASRSG
ncbi:HAD family hydrolase [Microbispora sp. H13382]|uniref:HAD family hydrolase n=1 Tax=Microbispora sp. H13382 TaxID=2729112 RepID=UPI001603FD8E|nr:HAD family phosphatase [Microbispora sp. H13382]